MPALVARRITLLLSFTHHRITRTPICVRLLRVYLDLTKSTETHADDLSSSSDEAS